MHRIRPLLSTGLAILLLVAPSVAPAAPGSPTHFARDPARLKAKEAQIVTAMRTQNPEAADQLQQMFNQDIIAQLEPAFRASGLDSSDMADMTTAYWINAWEAVHGIVGRRTDPALVQGAKRQIAGVMARNPNLARMNDAQRQDVADVMILQSLIIAARAEAAAKQGPDAVRQMSAAIAQEAQQLIKTDLRLVTLTAEGFKPNGTIAGSKATPGTSPSAPGTGPTPPAPSGAISNAPHPENWSGVEGVYFRSVFTFGVGGMMIQDFQPVILFRDGSYYKVEGPALEDIDLAGSKASQPRRWGRWTKSAAGYALSNDKGGPGEPVKLQEGRFFRAIAADGGGGKLVKTYRRVSGGGNMSLGGDTIVASQTDIAFAADGSFNRASGGGGFTNGQWSNGAQVAASSHRASAGRYRINRYSITMTQPDGSVKRQFFAFGTQGASASVDTDMMFIGPNVFTVMHRR